MKKQTEELPNHLHRVNPEGFGIVRRKRGKGYTFCRLADGRPVRDPKTRDFLASVPVPNTWTEVRLTTDPRAHIQATGYDGSGKHQYLYHEDYLEYRNEQKFAELLDFGLALPRIRRRIARDLREQQWNERKLLALIVKILDKYHLRIGTRVYARHNQSYGLTTLRKKHLRETEEDIRFDYVGKAGQKLSVVLHDPQLVELVRELAEFPGHELFSIRQGSHRIRADAEAINAYIKHISASDFTARSFRTWAGTVLAVRYYERARRIVRDNPRRELPAVLTELVAQRLGNTSSICRAYYIHPGVFETVISGDFDPAPCDEQFLRRSGYRRHECRTMEILSRL